MKKLFAITLLMALVINGFAQNQFDFSSVCETGQTLFYRITDGETHTVILTHPCSENDPGFEGDYYGYHPHPEGDVVIPSQVTHNDIDYLVTAIDSRSFWDCLITSVFIPNSVNNIVPGTFSSCEFLESISMDEENPTYYSENNTIIRREDNALVVGCKASTIPEGVEIICQNAFFCMGNNGVLTIPNSVRIIEEGAFAYNHFSGSLILPESLETLGPMAFYVGGFSGSLTMPNSVTEIGHHAFYGCRFSGNLTLSSSLSTITNCAFADCHFSGTLVIPNSVNLIVGAAFYGNNFSELVLGESVATIESIAFSGCNNLTGTLRLPTSLTQIDQMAFKNTSFDEIYSPNRIPPTLASNAFQGYDANIPIHIPFGCTGAYQNSGGWNYFTNFIEEEPIIYTDYEPDTCKMITSNHESDFMFDIDHDGIVDMTLSGYIQHGAVLVTIDMSNGFELCRSNENTVLNADTIVWFGSDDLSNGYPLDSYRKSVGFRKTVNGHYYYGWMEVYWDGVFYSEGKMIYVDRIAFCTIPDYPLVWGQMSLDQIGEEGAEWYYEILNDNGSITYQHLECAADTTINSERPKIIIRSNTQYDKDLHTEVTHEYIYEENGVVYWWNKTLEEFTVLYNLGAGVGDEWEIKVGTESLTMHVDAVENIDYEGRTFRMLRVSDENDLFSGNIVCGIGHLTSFFPERLMTRGKSYCIEGMRCYWVNGDLTFKIGDEDCDAIYEEWHGIEEDGPSTGSGTFMLYPNPANNVLFVETCHGASLPTQTYRITNPLGQTVLSGYITAENQQINIETLPAGMYFISVGEQTVKFVKQ